MKNEKLLVALVPFSLFFYLFLLGLNSTKPLPITFDSAMHALIVDPVISSQVYPLTWLPLVKTQYTYPPLFHWISFIFIFVGAKAIQSVNFLGIFFYAIFPILAYKLGSIWGKRIAFFSALVSVGVTSLSYVFAVGEYPQLLAMDLSIIFLYFLLKKDFVKAGLFLGLASLSHAFIPVYFLPFLLFYSIFSFLKTKNKKAIFGMLKLFLISLIVCSIWLYQYFSIVINATTGKWMNVRWYPKSIIRTFNEIKTFFLNFNFETRLHPTLFFLSMLGSVLMIRKKEFFIPFLLFYTILFCILHVPGTQLKFQDMLALPVIIPISFGLDFILSFLKKKSLGIATVLFLIALNLPNPWLYLEHTKKCCTQAEVPDERGMKSAEWLASYDYNYSRILVAKPYEVWFSVISHKYPMDVMLTDIEAYSEEAKEMVNDRKIIIQKIEGGEDFSYLLKKHEIKYLVVENVSLNYEEIFSTNGLKIYKVS
ncbi:MAG: hypothetical protein ACP5O8_02550 [Candidatus Aenigmatarchaeota archaeon]